jgi:hypothetical protein
LNSFPDQIQRLKPAIGCGFVAYLPPDPLLGVEARLVGREIDETNSLVSSQEDSDLFAFMPPRAINIQPNLIPLKPTIELPETIQKSIPVALRAGQHSHPTQQRGNPPEDVQSFPMLTGCEHLQSAANFTPPSAKTRMKGKARFIFKNNSLFSCQQLEFFLRSDEIFSHPRSALADTCIRIFSSGTLIGASTTGLGVPSGEFQIDSSSGQPRSDHPSGRGSDQNPQAIFPVVPPNLAELVRSAELVAQVSSPASGTPDLSRSPGASTSSSFDASDRVLRQPIPDADPPMSAEEPQFLFQRRPPGFPELLLTNWVGLLLDEPTLNWVFS